MCLVSSTTAPFRRRRRDVRIQPLRFVARRCKTPHSSTKWVRGMGVVSSTTAPSRKSSCETVQGRQPTLACLWLGAREYEGRQGAGEWGPETAIAAAAGGRATPGTRETVSAPVQVDAEGFPFIPGRYGQIEWHCD